jgi:hypothetical protein
MRALRGWLANGMLALVLTFASSFHQHDHGERALFGDCDPTSSNYRIRMVAGWPAPYLADRIGVSVEGTVSWVEDDFRGRSFVASYGFWLLVTMASATATGWVLSRSHSRAE